MLSKTRIRQIIKENIQNIILESQESKSIDAAKKLVMQKLGYTPEQADKLVRYNIRHDLPFFSRNKKGNKFILGVTRMFLNGQLRDASTMNTLNTTLKHVASDAHYNEYDRNLNGMSAQDLIDRFAKNVEMDLENDRNEVNSMQFDDGQSQYDIVRIDSFEEACKYNKYTYDESQWCITYSKGNYDSYTCNGMNQLYFCLKRGFKNVVPVPSEGCPLDEYGLSMISVIVNENGALAYCTSRWNHENGGNDSVMDTKQISEVIGMNFYNVFKPNNKWKEMVETSIQRLRNGEDPKEVFDHRGFFYDGLATVALNGKWNWIRENGSIVFPNRWFDGCSDFHNGYARVMLNVKWSIIREDGSLVWDKPVEQWFDYCDIFCNGYAKVLLNRKWNFINEDGKLVSPNRWFGGCGDFHNGYAKVGIKGKWNWIREDGTPLLDKSYKEWFDFCSDFHEGFAVVDLNGKYYNIDTKGYLYKYRTDEPLGINVNAVDMQNESNNRNIKNKQRKTIIRLTESILDDIIKRSVKSILKLH